MVPATVLQSSSFTSSIPTACSLASSSSSSSTSAPPPSPSPSYSSLLPAACRHCSASAAATGFRCSRPEFLSGEHSSFKQLIRRSSHSHSSGLARWGLPVISSCAHPDPSDSQVEGWQQNFYTKVLQRCAVCLLAAATVVSIHPAISPANAFERGPVLPELSVLISGPPIKDPNALLRNALPINNKPIKELQKSLEDISENLRLPGVKAIDPVERSIRQAARILNQNKPSLLASIAESKKELGQDLLDKLTVGLQEFQKIVEDKNREAIAPKQKELLYIVGDVEEAMVEKFPFEVPEEYGSKPLLKGRATVEMKIRVKDNPNLKDVVFQMVLDGYNAPVTAGNFVDLVERHFYDGMEIQRADGFVVQTGDPDGPAEGFVDPSTEKIRTVPLEIMVDGDKEPIYGATLEELGRYKARMKIPFNAFGTLAMARDEFDDNSASSQIFWLLKESELTPSSANILDGRYAVFGYVTENQDLLADLKVGDVIESIKVVAGLDNLVNPSYKIVS